jgi:hypothetical protein
MLRAVSPQSYKYAEDLLRAVRCLKQPATIHEAVWDKERAYHRSHALRQSQIWTQDHKRAIVERDLSLNPTRILRCQGRPAANVTASRTPVVIGHQASPPWGYMSRAPAYYITCHIPVMIFSGIGAFRPHVGTEHR